QPRLHAVGDAVDRGTEGFGTQAGADQRIALPGGARGRILQGAPDHHLRLLARQLAVEQGGQLTDSFLAHPDSSARPRPPSKTSDSLRSIASRARKIRDRTVPTGQSIACAMSS